MSSLSTVVFSTQNLVGGRLPVGEGRGAGEQLEDEDAEGPDVGALVVRLVGDDLRGDVLGGATERPGPLLPNL